MASVQPNLILRLAGLLFAISAFIIGPALFAYMAAFLGNLWPHTSPWVDPSVDIGKTFPIHWAVLNNIFLMALFGLQHSLMSRTWFKAWMCRHVPHDLERTCYVMASNIVLLLLLLFWRPIPIVLYDLGDGVLEDVVWAVFAFGWILLIAGLLALGPRDLLGLNQALAWYNGNRYQEPPFVSNWLFERVRHPLYMALLICLWVTPHMTLGHVLFAAGLSTYIAFGIRLEERDLIGRFGKAYADYQARTPAVIPRFFN